MAAVSVAPVPNQADCAAAREALAEFAAGREEMEHFLTEMLDHLESLWGRLEERHRAIASQRAQLDEELRKRGDEPDRKSDAPGDRKKRNRSELRRGVAAATAEFAEAMVHQRLRMAKERAKWHEELKQMRQLLELVAQRQADSSPK